MASRGHALVLGTGIGKVPRMSGAAGEERHRRRQLWDCQCVDEMLEFVGSRLKDP